MRTWIYNKGKQINNKYILSPFPHKPSDTMKSVFFKLRKNIECIHDVVHTRPFISNCLLKHRISVRLFQYVTCPLTPHEYSLTCVVIYMVVIDAHNTVGCAPANSHFVE